MSIKLNEMLAFAAIFSAIARMTEFGLLWGKKKSSFSCLVDSVSSLLDFEVKSFSDPSDRILLALKAKGDPAF